MVWVKHLFMQDSLHQWLWHLKWCWNFPQADLRVRMSYSMTTIHTIHWQPQSAPFLPKDSVSHKQWSMERNVAWLGVQQIGLGNLSIFQHTTILPPLNFMHFKRIWCMSAHPHLCSLFSMLFQRSTLLHFHIQNEVQITSDHTYFIPHS
jgi:hypothetical protein